MGSEMCIRDSRNPLPKPNSTETGGVAFLAGRVEPFSPSSAGRPKLSGGADVAVEHRPYGAPVSLLRGAREADPTTGPALPEVSKLDADPIHPSVALPAPLALRRWFRIRGSERGRGHAGKSVRAPPSDRHSLHRPVCPTAQIRSIAGGSVEVPQ